MVSRVPRRRSVACVATSVFVLLAGGKASFALPIDDFSVGPIQVSRTGATAVTASQTGLDPSHVLGGGREIVVGESGGFVQTLIIDTAERELRFATDTNGYFQIDYGTPAAPLDVDLTADGSNAFLFESLYIVPTFPAATVPPSFIRVFSATGSGTASLTSSGASIVVQPDGSRRIKLPFSLLGNQVDLTAVQRIELDVFRVAPGSTFSLRTFSTVPEPESMLLFVFGAALVAAGRHFACRANGA
jgi:hypothetical protein